MINRKEYLFKCRESGKYIKYNILFRWFKSFIKDFELKVDDDFLQPLNDIGFGKPCVNKSELTTYSKCMINKETQTSKYENRLLKNTVVPLNKVFCADKATEKATEKVKSLICTFGCLLCLSFRSKLEKTVSYSLMLNNGLTASGPN